MHLRRRRQAPLRRFPAVRGRSVTSSSPRHPGTSGSRRSDPRERSSGSVPQQSQERQGRAARKPCSALVREFMHPSGSSGAPPGRSPSRARTGANTHRRSRSVSPGRTSTATRRRSTRSWTPPSPPEPSPRRARRRRRADPWRRRWPRGRVVNYSCGNDVDAYTAAVTIDDGTDSASADVTVSLIPREDGWKVWGVY